MNDLTAKERIFLSAALATYAASIGGGEHTLDLGASIVAKLGLEKEFDQLSHEMAKKLFGQTIPANN